MKIKFLYLISIILLISCSSDFNYYDENNVTASDSSRGLLNITFNNQTTRTVLPNNINLEDLENFILSGAKDNTDLVELGSWNSYEDCINNILEIETGFWNFTLTANKGKSIYSAEVEKQINNGSNTISFNLALSKLGDGNGSFMIEVDYNLAENANQVKIAKITLENRNGLELSEYTEYLFPSDNKIIYKKGCILAGNYRFVLTLYADSAATLKLIDYSEIILIASDMQSNASRTIESFNEVNHITYVLNDDVENPAYLNGAQESFTKYSDFNLMEPTREGYNFAGWWTDNNCLKQIKNIDSTVKEDISVYAKWVKGLPATAENIEEILSFLSNGDELCFVGPISNEILSIIAEFLKKSNLSNISLNFKDSNSIEEFDSNFIGCESLTNIVLPDCITTLGNSFSYCRNLITVKIPDMLEILYAGTFRSCENLKYINIPNTVKYIGAECFRNCKSLESIEIPKNVKIIGESAFNSCEQISNVILVDGLEEIERAAFGYCKNISKIIIPKTVKKVGEMAFTCCENLREITLSPGILFGYEVFISTPGKKLYYTGDLKSWCEDSYNVLNSELFINNKHLEGDVIIPDGIKVIKKGCILGENITSVYIPDSVMIIEMGAFTRCNKSATLTFGYSGIWYYSYGGIDNNSTKTAYLDMDKLYSSYYWFRK